MKKRITKLECPSCGASLSRKLFIGKYKCNYCGNIFVIDRKYEIKKEYIKVVTGISVIAIMGACIALAGSAKNNNKTILQKPKINYTGSIDKSKHEALDYPSSDYMKKVLSVIFNKPYEDVTKEEIGSITYIDIKSHWGTYGVEDELDIIYSFEDYHDYDTYDEFEEHLLCSKINKSELQNERYKWEDFTSFKGLKYSPMVRISDVKTYADAYQHLTGVDMRNDHEDVEALKEISANHDIDMLYVDSEIMEDNADSEYSFLDDMKNLKILNVSMDEKTEFPEKIGELSNLNELIVTDADDIKEFNVIKNLTNLKVLKIESAKSLKTLDFIGDLKLKTLSIEAYELKDFSVLKGNDTIEKLKIITSYNNAQFEPVSTMKNVKELDIDASDYTDYELIGNLKSVEKLYLKMFDTTRSMCFLRNMTELKEAEFNGCTFNGDLSVLSGANNLKKVLFKNGDVNYITMSLNELKSVEDVTFDVPDGSILYLDELLPNDKIKKLTIENGELWFDKDTITNNMRLEELTVKDVKPIDKNYQKTEFDRYFKEICNINTLKKLTVTGCNLTDISGISKLKNLEELDISDNYVRDVSEITNLNSLKRLNVSDNATSDVPEELEKYE